MARILPSGFRQLEYLQSDGACYIDTTLTANNTDDVRIKMRHLGTASTTSAYFGNMPGKGDILPRYCFGKSGKDFVGINDTHYFDQALDTDWHVIGQYYDGTSYKAIRDGETITMAVTTTWDQNFTAYLFARHGTGGVQTYDGEGTAVAYLDWKDASGNQRAYYVPAKRTSDNKLGMYDLVTNTFFTNSGTGTFTAGPVVDIDDTLYRELEYIQSSGTQYIDTGLHITTNYAKVKAKITPLDWDGSNPNRRGWGVQGTSDSCFTAWDNSVSGSGSTHPDGWLALGNSWYFNKTSSTFFNTTLGQPYEMDFTANNGTAVGSYAGESFSASYSGSLINSSRSIYLFDCNAHYTHTPTSSKIYYFYIETAEGIKNFIPVKRKSDGAIGMVNTINDTFFANSGTGEFIPGPYVGSIEYTSYKKDIKVIVGKVPSEYDELEYIQMPAMSWIDSGTLPQDVDTTYLEASITDLTSSQYFLGVRNPYSVAIGYALNFYTHGGLNYYPCSWPSDGYAATVDKKFTMTTYLSDTSDTSCQIDDNPLITQAYSGITWRSSNTPIAINALRSCDLGGIEYPGQNVKYYIIKMLRNNNLIREFIPVKRKSDSVLGMYDTVNNIFYTNSGTGSFIAGPEILSEEIKDCYKSLITLPNPEYVVPSGYTQLDYIEGIVNAGSLIDTGFTPNNNSSAEIDFTVTNNSNSNAKVLFGTVGSSYADNSFGIYYNVNTYYNHKSDTNVSSYIPSAEIRTIGQRHKIKLHKNTIYYDDNLVYTYPLTPTFTSPSHLFLGKNYGTSDGFIYKCHNAKVWDNDTQIRNLIPAKRNSDQALGMYDTCSSGKNLFDVDYLLQQTPTPYLNYGNAKWIELTLKPNTNYTMSTNGYGASGGVRDDNRSLYFAVPEDTTMNNYCHSQQPITLNSGNSGKLRVVIYCERANAIQYLNKTAWIQIEEGSSVTEYEPYPFYTNAGTGVFTAGPEIATTKTYTLFKRIINI